MSVKSSVKTVVEDLWAKLEAQPVQVTEDNNDTNTLFIGDSGCGKSSLIQTFLKPTVTKEPKPTFALEYSFARKKGNSTTGAQSNSKCVAHIWELGGDINEPRLIDIAISVKNIAATTVVICCDLSRPQNALASLKKWITLIRDSIKKRLAELKVNNPTEVSSLRERAYSQYEENLNDRTRVKPCEVPIVIIANKYDILKTKSVSERRSVMQVMRFIAHLHGASLYVTSSTEPSLKEGLRNFINSICFRLPLKSSCDVAIDKPATITAGRDDFTQILISSLSENSSSTAAKSRLIYSESDVPSFLTPQGPAPECWSRFTEHLAVMFGQPDASIDAPADAEDRREENEFPEAEVDEMRAQRDMALQRYIQVSNISNFTIIFL